MSANTDFLYTEWYRASEEYTIARGKADRASHEADLAYDRLKFAQMAYSLQCKKEEEEERNATQS